MSAVIEYRGDRNIAELTAELKERGYQIESLTKELAAVSSIEAIKSMKPMILQDVTEELKSLKHGIARFVYSRPEQAEAKLNQILTYPRMPRQHITIANLLRGHL